MYDPRDITRIKTEVKEEKNEKVLLYIDPATAVTSPVDDQLICTICKSVANPPLYDVNCG